MGFPEKPNQEGRFKVHQPDPDTNRLMTLAELKIMELRFKQAAEKTIKRVKALRDERARCEERLRQIDEELHQLEGDLRASSISPGNIPSLPEVGVRPRQGSPNPKGRGRDPNSIPSRIIALLPAHVGKVLNTSVLTQALGLSDEPKTRAALSAALGELKNRGLIERLRHGEYSVVEQPPASASPAPTAQPPEPPPPPKKAEVV